MKSTFPWDFAPRDALLARKMFGFYGNMFSMPEMTRLPAGSRKLRRRGAPEQFPAAGKEWNLIFVSPLREIRFNIRLPSPPGKAPYAISFFAVRNSVFNIAFSRGFGSKINFSLGFWHRKRCVSL